MMHSFPRTFSLPPGRAERARAPTITFAPLTPASYLRLCRDAANMSRLAVAALIAPHQRDIGQVVDLLDLLETPGSVARRSETLDRLRAAFPFDPDVYHQLATEPPGRHPRVCRGCAASTWNPNDAAGPLRWATDYACTRCAGAEDAGDAA